MSTCAGSAEPKCSSWRAAICQTKSGRSPQPELEGARVTCASWRKAAADDDEAQGVREEPLPPGPV